MKSINGVTTTTYLLKCLLLLVGLAEAELAMKICSFENLFSCPSNSLCTQISNDENDAPKCVCLESFLLNPNWMEYENLYAFSSSSSSSAYLLQEHYCLVANETPKANDNKLLNYIRSPARKEHLAFGILMVLLAASLATVVLYGVKVLSPLKRTISIYKKFKYKRRNIIPLQELDELELNRRYEMQTL